MTLKLDHHFAPSRSLAASYFFLKGTDTQPMSNATVGSGPYSMGGPRLHVDATQPESGGHVDHGIVDGQPAATPTRASTARV